MARWSYYTHRSSDGEPVGELPLSGVEIEDVLSGTASLTGSLPLYDWPAQRSLTAPWLREITAVRDGVIAFHGPVVGRTPTLNGKSVAISAASPHAYFRKRVTETLRKYNRDEFSLVRSLVTDATAKTGGDLYRLTVSTGMAGVTKQITVGGVIRRYVSDVIEDLAKDNDTGFDFRWDFTWLSQPQHTINRKLTLGYPEIGRDLTVGLNPRVIEQTIDLVDVTDAEDGLKSANRWHGLGAATKTGRLRSVANSGSSLAAGYPLLEDVVDFGDINSQAQLDLMTTYLRNARLPGTRTFETKHTISDHLPYGAVDLGDKVTIKVTAGAESVNFARRVVLIRTQPETDQVGFVYYDPADAA